MVCACDTNSNLVRKIQTRGISIYNLQDVSDNAALCHIQSISAHQLIQELFSFVKCPNWEIGTTLDKLLRDIGKGCGVPLEGFHKASIGTEDDFEKIRGKVTPVCNVGATVRYSKEDQPSHTVQQVCIMFQSLMRED